MRIFWSIVGLLVFASAAMLWARSAANEATAPDSSTPERSIEPIAEPTPEGPEPPGEAGTHDPDEADALAAELLAASAVREEPAANEVRAAAPATSAAPIDAGAVTPTPAGSFPLENTVPVVVKPLDDGSVLLDDRFVLRGSGTEDDPFLITWDLLISASETYTPRLGMFKLPQRITMLHDRYVKITGHVAFPPGAAEVRELLAMMNMWDGCCIGVPPSPYDALEVKLREPMAVARQHFSPFATVQGRLKVDPFLIENWLVGLYLLEDATMNMEL
jgi:hypothetical protein